MKKMRLRREAFYVVAVSGGPDSMALWHMLLQRGFHVVAAHVNYHHREEADAEEQMVRSFAETYGCPLEVSEAYFSGKGNFENWARKIRYDFFGEVADRYHASGCLVAHHRDDLLETYLLQKRRGYVEFYGLKERNEICGITVFRPLLKMTKPELEAYCLKQGIPFSYDRTNGDLTLSRNKIRHTVLSEMNEKEKSALIREIDAGNREIRRMEKEIAPNLYDGVQVMKLTSYSDEMFARWLYRFLRQKENVVLSGRRVREIRSLLSKSGNLVIYEGKGYDLIKEYDCLKRVKKKSYNYCIIVDKPSVIDTDYFYIDLLRDPSRFYVREDSYPLTIRNADPKHRIRIGKIHKSVNRILIDAKIPYLQRLYWPEIVNNRGEILFVPRSSGEEEGLFIVKSF